MLIGAIPEQHIMSREHRSAIDALRIPLTQAHEWLPKKKKANKLSKAAKRTCPTIMAKDIEGACTYINHSRLINIITHFNLPKDIVATIEDFSLDRTIAMPFDGETEVPARFTAGFPQGSPLAPVLFMLYPYVLTLGHKTEMPTTTSYIDHNIMLDGAKSHEFARRRLQERLKERIRGAGYQKI